jgi:hypothetical protein
MSLGALQKMKLVAYSDINFKNKVPKAEYEVLINPESYSLSYGSETNDITGQGSSESIRSFNKRPAQTMTFRFLFDGTGVIKKGDEGLLSGLAIPGKPAAKRDVVADFNTFKEVVYCYDGDTHSPRYVQLQWGPLIYNCQLTTMTVNFKLFKPDGTPIRAEADCTFQSAIDQEKLSAIEGRKSPDLSHVRTVKEGDTLSLLCYREYGDSKYYYQVAQFNGLTNFKQLTPGMKLVFPPVAK